jgi:hypothetical protein
MILQAIMRVDDNPATETINLACARAIWITSSTAWRTI